MDVRVSMNDIMEDHKYVSFENSFLAPIMGTGPKPTDVLNNACDPAFNHNLKFQKSQILLGQKKKVRPLAMPSLDKLKVIQVSTKRTR